MIRIPVRIQQVLKGGAHGHIHLLVRVVPVFVVVTDHEQNSQTHRLGGRAGKLHAAVILRSRLRLCDQAFNVVIILVLLDAQMGFHLINVDDHSFSPHSDSGAAMRPASRSAASRRL